jgi:DNA-binding CsgD family transcriptional regulator/tetratricopeptide (TPR) repeat protein
VDAHGAEEEWAVSALQEASERAVADGDASRAIAYLRRAESGCSDARQRAAIRFALASAEWAISPEGAARHLPELVTDAHQGRLDSAAIGSLAYCLLWMGDTGRAAGILGMLDTHPHHIRFICPELAKQDRNSGRPVTGTDNDAAVILAERTLRERGLNDPTLASLTTAFMSLICEDMLDRSAFWCNALMQDSGVPYGGVLRKAVLTGFLAMIETRRGDLQDAENHARTALDMLTRKAWGVAIGAPLSSLLLTSIASGRQEDAAAWLRVPVPEEMFRTPYGLLYLYARGEYYLATACPQAALADFTDCGNRMVAWDLDQPGLVPWRTKAAEVYLAMGDNLKARELCRQQLAQAGSRYSRTRGISLRALALTSHPGKRTALLRESVEVLRDCGAWLELAYTFSELSNTHLALGEDSRAHWAARQARNLAERCGAQTLEMTLGKRDREPPEADNGAGVSLLDRLSDAERRVAVLAACGYTNIQIAHKLYITVSTVEQHLTRVYRKLEVAGRAELPVEI